MLAPRTSPTRAGPGTSSTCPPATGCWCTRQATPRTAAGTPRPAPHRWSPTSPSCSRNPAPKAANAPRRRGDRRWLRHVVTTLINPDDAPVDDAWHAGQLAGLLLARVDARILTARDVRSARAAVAAVLGRKRLAQLRDVWKTAHTVDDTDADTMIELAWRWCRILGIDPNRHPNVPTPDLGMFAGQLAAAITDYLAAAAGLTPAEYVAQAMAGRHGAPALWTRRDPTTAERHAARHLAARLRRARTHTDEPGRQPAAIPPGRLRTRHAITVAAQRDAGTIPTAAPWQRRANMPPHKPTLHLGVLVDA